jgi:hypothetical protein
MHETSNEDKNTSHKILRLPDVHHKSQISGEGLLNLLQQLETKLFNLAKRVREVIDSANESTLRN